MILPTANVQKVVAVAWSRSWDEAGARSRTTPEERAARFARSVEWQRLPSLTRWARRRAGEDMPLTFGFVASRRTVVCAFPDYADGAVIVLAFDGSVPPPSADRALHRAMLEVQTKETLHALGRM